MSAAPIEPAAPRLLPVPRTPVPLFDEFPSELARMPQWVCWRLEWRPNSKKWTKVPYTPAPNGMNVSMHASTTNPATWRPLADCEMVYKFGKVDGVGFVFSAADPYCGVDLDGCRDPANGTLDAWAQPLVQQAVALGLFVEVSVSGTGLHIIGRGRWGDGKRKGGVEVYDRERFFTMSGDRTGYPDGSVNGDAQPLLDHIRVTLLHEEPGIEITDAEVHRRRDGLALVHRARELDPGLVENWADGFMNRAGEQARGWWFTSHVEGRSEERQGLLWRVAADRVTNGMADSPEKVAIEVAAVVMRSPRYEAESARGKWPRLIAMEITKATASAWAKKAANRAIVIELPAAAVRDVTNPDDGLARSGPAAAAQDVQEGADDGRMGDETSTVAAAAPAPSMQAGTAVTVRVDAGEVASAPVELPVVLAPAPAQLAGPWSQQSVAQRLGYPEPPPGPIAESVEWITANAAKEQPMLALLSTVVAFSAACGSQYALPDGSRLNLYGIGVALTAAGKDAPRSAAMELAQEAGIPPVTDIGSGQGLEDVLIERQSVIAVIDEIGHFVRIVEGAKAPPHLVSASKLLLTMFTAGKSRYHRRVLAQGQAKREPAMMSVDNPMLSLLGFTTPSALGQGLTSAAIESGLLGRMLFVEGEEQPFSKFMPPLQQMPESVRDRLRAIHQARQEHKLCNVCTVEFEPDALAMAERIMREREAARVGLEPHAGALVARGAEKVSRIAGVLAVLDNPVEPRIRVEHVRWADTFVRASDRAAIEFVAGRVHDSELMEKVAKVRRTLAAALDGKYKTKGASEEQLLKAGLVPRSLLLRASKEDTRTVQQAIEHLVDADEVVHEVIPSRHPNGGEKRTDVYRFA